MAEVNCIEEDFELRLACMAGNASIPGNLLRRVLDETRRLRATLAAREMEIDALKRIYGHEALGTEAKETP